MTPNPPQSERPNDSPRRNASRLFDGTEPFLADLSGRDDWVGGTVRSKVAHGKLIRLRFDASFDWSRVVVITPAEIPGVNEVECHEHDQPSLCDETIRHCGEPLALIAAPNGDLLHKALRAVEAIVEPLPAVFDPFESLKGEVRIFGKDNVFLDIPIRRGDPESALATAEVVVESTHFTPAQEHAYLETQAMRATPIGEGVIIEGSMQCPYYLVSGVARLLGIPKSAVRVIALQTGGGFGGKEDFPTMLAGHVAMLARKCGRPVRMIFDRVQDMTVTTKRHPAWIRRRTGFDRSGTIRAVEVDIILDGGAYATLSPFVLSRAALHAVGPYRCDHVSVHARAVATHHPPNGAFRGFGCPQVHFATETHMDQCAETLGIDPVELRRINMIRPGDALPFGQIVLSETDPGRLLTEAIRRADFDRRRAEILTRNLESERRPGRAGTYRSGLGLAIFMHGTGLNAYWERSSGSRVRLEATSEGQVRVLTAQTEFGQGTLTSLGRIAAEAIDLDESDIRVDHPDTAESPDSGPTVASRTVSIVGSLIREAAERMRKRIADEFGPDSLANPLALKSAIARLASELPSPIFEAAYECSTPSDESSPWAPRDAYPAYSLGCCIAEVRVDLLTGEIVVPRMDMVCDIGDVICDELATNQVIGGAAQGLGWALTERLTWDVHGRMRNASLSDYAIPSAADVPTIHVSFVGASSGESPHPRGLGEMPIEGPAPAIANAVAMATGRRPERLPIGPDWIIQARGQVSS